MEIEQAKNEALAKQQTRVKTSAGSAPSKVAKQEVVQKTTVNKQTEVKRVVQPAVKTIVQSVIKPTAQTEIITTNADKYASLDIDALYSEVRKFMQLKGVAKSIVDKKMLEAEFGVQNIKKLILKSYLISIGKGVTIGR